MKFKQCVMKYCSFNPNDDLINVQMVKNQPFDSDPAFHRYESDGDAVWVHVSGDVAELMAKTRVLSDRFITRIMADVFASDPRVSRIHIRGLGCNYRNMLVRGHWWILDLPDTVEDLDARVGRKGLYNMRRAEKKIKEEVVSHEISYDVFDENIPDSLVRQYFELKSKTHAADYGLTPRQYVKDYGITGAMKLSAGDKLLAVLFYCESGQTVYLENISYDEAVSKWSPGILLYYHFLKYMVMRNNVRRIFLGSGWEPYKERFGGTCYATYNGVVFRSKMKTIAFSMLNRLRHKALDVAYGNKYR